MAQVPVIETLYLYGVLAAFAAFAVTLLAVSIHTHIPDRPRVVGAAQIDILIGEAVVSG